MFFYYTQMVLVFYGTDSLVSFLNIFNFSIHQSSPVCIVSVSPGQEASLGLVVPVVSLGELLLIGVIDFGVRKLALLDTFPALLRKRWSGPFKLAAYVRTFVAWFLFSCMGCLCVCFLIACLQTIK